MIEIVPARSAHIEPIAANMREADREECAAFGRTPLEALEMGLTASVLASTATIDGIPHAMFGLTPINALEGKGRPWFLGTGAALHCARPLLEFGPAVIAAMHRRFTRLENYVSVTNRPAIRMLRAWGFSVGDEQMTFGGVEFVPFWREKH